MTPSVKRILDEVNKLTPFERAEIIDLILESFDNQGDKDIEKAWIDEARRRLESYKKGETGFSTEDEVFSSIVSDSGK